MLTLIITFHRVSKQDVAKLKDRCYEKGGIIDSIETYDFKLSSKIGKLDVRVKFKNAKPKIIMVKKFEYKVAIFDVLCLGRYASTCIIVIIWCDCMLC